MRVVRSIFVVLLLVLWPAVTSHSLLEHAGMIHEVHVDHHHADGESHKHPDHHDFADGNYWSKVSGAHKLHPKFPPLYEVAWLAAVLTNAPELGDETFFGPAPPGIAPPEFRHRWNFLLRTAPDARAPSFLL